MKKYNVIYKDEILCTCETETAARLITSSINYMAYNHDGVEEMEAADTLRIEEVTI